MHGEVQLLLDLIDEAFDHKSWHGTTLLGSLKGMTASAASWRPGAERHNIWELTVHAAYWKYAVRRRLTGEKRGSFAYKGSNWFVRPAERARPSGEAVDAAWSSDVRLLLAEHARLRDVVARLSPGALHKRIDGKSVTAAHLIRGIAAHDLYHAGQIQLVKRLRRDASA
jgi:hypothetical protein